MMKISGLKIICIEQIFVAFFAVSQFFVLNLPRKYF